MDTKNVQLNDTITPFYVIAGILTLLGILSFFSPLPELKAKGENESKSEDTTGSDKRKMNVFQFPHLVLGAVAIFLYVGIEVIALVSVNDYATFIGLDSPEQYVGYTSVAMVAGYVPGIFLIPSIISQINAFRICSFLGVLSTFLIVTLPAEVSVFFVALLGLANSLVWPAIWPLALSDLGNFTKAGSSFLVMGIVGGGILPPILGCLKDFFSY
jgi:fucose permease